MSVKAPGHRQKPAEPVNVADVEAALEQARPHLRQKVYEILLALAVSYAYIVALIEKKKTTIRRLRQIIFGSKTEKSSKVLRKKGKGKKADADGETDAGATQGGDEQKDGDAEPKEPPKGHGRNGADAYTGADRIPVPHESLKSGDPCPDCGAGKVYPQRPSNFVWVVGQAPLGGTIFDRERLRCNICGKVFCAKAPHEKKYDVTAPSMIAVLKYGSGLPFNRLERLQGGFGIPLPASTQWDLVHKAADLIEPAFDELCRQAAQGELLHNDDTVMRILELMKGQDSAETGEEKDKEEKDGERTGIFTSGIVAILEGGQKIVLFMTGNKHAGERLQQVLERRDPELGAPIQMCDALPQNVPKGFEVILANCNAHGRRKFVEVAENFPPQCRYVLECFRLIYAADDRAREQNLSPQERLELHKAESGPVMEELKVWIDKQLDEHLVEPNSGLGEALQYLKNHWPKLTRFLEVPGVPLDNNVCERALKKAILHRRNALFYKTQNGARVGDMYMSLIHTAELCGANPFDYLTELQRNAGEVRANPSAWMPWNYQDAAAASETAVVAS